ncbi:hypothetical protein [Ascidiimonas sp. W6]|uniref:hypothetical protein n=1 Tax=Ascidiimonas meishanensis TaxID=3128903 RepID=UPI0030EB7875
MEPNKFEKEIQDKFLKREIKPSPDSWIKLNEMLPESPNKSFRNTHFYWFAAASIAIILAVVNYSVDRNQGELPSNQIPIVDSFEENEKSMNTIIKNEKELYSSENSNASKVQKQELKVTLNQEKELPVIDKNIGITSNEIKKETKQPDTLELQGVDKNEDAVAAVFLEAKRIQEAQGDISEETIDSLILKAQQRIKINNALQKSNTPKAAMALLQDVEEELDQSFRDKVFELLKKGMVKVKTAVAERNQ